jgi:hypothetical protein
MGLNWVACYSFGWSVGSRLRWNEGIRTTMVLLFQALGVYFFLRTGDIQNYFRDQSIHQSLPDNLHHQLSQRVLKARDLIFKCSISFIRLDLVSTTLFLHSMELTQ